MKKSELKRIIQEELKGYSKYYPGGETKGGTSDEFGTILRNIALGTPEKDPKDKEPIKEGEGGLYSKEDAIQYIENNLGAKYYKIGVSKGVQQTSNTPNQAIQIIQSSPINQFELNTYGEVISFSAPFDEKHADVVRSMGSLD